MDVAKNSARWPGGGPSNHLPFLDLLPQSFEFRNPLRHLRTQASRRRMPRDPAPLPASATVMIIILPSSVLSYHTIAARTTAQTSASERRSKHPKAKPVPEQCPGTARWVIIGRWQAGDGAGRCLRGIRVLPKPTGVPRQRNLRRRPKRTGVRQRELRGWRTTQRSVFVVRPVISVGGGESS